MSYEDNGEQRREHDPAADAKKKITFFVVALIVLVVAKFALGL